MAARVAHASVLERRRSRVPRKGTDGSLRVLDLLEPHVRVAVRDFDGAKVTAIYDSAAAGPHL